MTYEDVKTYLEQRKMENPDILVAYDLQCQIERLEKSLREHREEYDEIMNKLAREGVKGRFFNITELRPRREVDVNYVRENLPDAYEHCASLTNSAIIDILEGTNPDGKRGLIRSIKRLSPKKFAENAKINVGDIEKFLGKKLCQSLEGHAIKTVYHAGKQAKILYIGDKIQVGAGDGKSQEALTE